MKIASVADVKAKFSVYLKSSEEEGPVVITRNGRPVAVLLGVEDEEEIERLLMAYSPRLRAILDRSRVQIREGREHHTRAVVDRGRATRNEPQLTAHQKEQNYLTAQRPRDSGTAWQRANAEEPAQVLHRETRAAAGRWAGRSARTRGA